MEQYHENLSCWHFTTKVPAKLLQNEAGGPQMYIDYIYSAEQLYVWRENDDLQLKKLIKNFKLVLIL